MLQKKTSGPGRAVIRRIRMAAWLAALFVPCLSHAADKQWIGGDGNWSTNLDWSPFGVPGLGDTARLGSIGFVADQTVTVDGQFSVGGVELSDGMVLNTGPGRLVVQGDTTISGAMTTGVNQTELRVQNGASAIDFDTDTLSISQGAQVQMLGGRLDVDQQLLIGFGPSRLFGSGTVVLGGAGTALRNDGEIAAILGLTIQSVGGGAIDLDGVGGGGRVLATTGSTSLVFSGGTLTDDFSGDMEIIGGGSIAMNLSSPWAIDSNGLIRFTRNVGDPGAAILSGVAVGIVGDVEVDEDAYGRVTAATTFVAGASTSIAADGVLELDGSSDVAGGSFALDQRGLLQFDGATTVSGGQFTTATRRLNAGMVLFAGPTTWGGGETTINGAARQQGAATVGSPHAIAGGLLDLDGETGGTVWTINNSLTLNLDSIADGITDRFDGVMNVGGLFGGLSLNLAEPDAGWEMSGTLNLTGFGVAPITRVAGSAVTITGDVNVDGGAGIAADSTFTAASTVSFANAASRLLMRGSSRVDQNATFVGSGTLSNHTTGRMVLDNGLSLANADLANSGTLEIGLGPGSIAVGDFTQFGAGEWIVEIGGDFAASEHDQLLTSGSATLAGQLTPRLIDVGNGFFVPSVGDDFTVLLAPGGVSGAFDPIPLMAIGGELFEWEVEYNATQARLVLADIGGLLGDYNLDGVVDAADYTVWRDSLGNDANLAADGNQDGMVNQADYDVWVSNYGASLGVGEAVAVPEPAMIWLVIGAVAGAIRPRQAG
ncbi:hypothetical protein [Botrimarina sp.]|uniref:hypothetical protein n=1 Tax=Botrimarina sp. TaxID=2795802 RepID=UPI0032EF0CCB